MASLLGGNPVRVALSLLDSIVFQVNLDVGNGGILPIAVSSVDFDYSINGVPVGSG